MPPDFDFRQRGAQAAVPFVLHESVSDFDANYLRAIGRLRPGVTPAQAQAEVRTIAAQWREEFGLSDGFGTNATVQPLRDVITGPVRPQMLMLFGAVGMILLITAANVANLMLAKALSRQPEVSLRVALGASPWRLARQLLTEATLLGVVGGAIGFVVGVAGVRGLVGILPADTPRLAEIRVDLWVLAFSATIAVVVGWTVGLFPVLQARRVAVRDGLSAGGRASSGTLGRRRVRSGLVVAEVALAVVLLAGAGLLLKSFHRMTRVDVGMQIDGLVSFFLSPGRQGYPTPESTIAYYDLVVERLSATPGVESVGAVHTQPIGGGGWANQVQADGLEIAQGQRGPTTWWRAVTPGYFATVGMTLLRGRGFQESDAQNAPQVGIINETAARRLFAGADPLGRWVEMGGVRYTIVGTVTDVRILGVGRDAPPTLYLPFRQRGPALYTSFNTVGMVLMVRASDPRALMPTIRRVVREIDGDVPIERMDLMTEVVWEDLAAPRVLATLIALFAATALLLGAIPPGRPVSRRVPGLRLVAQRPDRR